MAKFRHHKTEPEHTSEGLPLVGIDMGSSSFKMLAAEETDPTNPYGSQLRIIAADESSKYRCVKKGIIVNTSEASYMIRESMLLMSNRLKMDNPLPTAFCVLGGKSMRCTPVKVLRNLGYKGPVRQSLLDEMRNESILKISRVQTTQPIVGLDARPASFLIDDQQMVETIEPESLIKSIAATYSTFYGLPDLKDKVAGSFERAGKSIEQAFARPSALLEALASEQDELIGLAIIDMGAETTTISIYKGGQFLSTKVLPFGGYNISLDIQHLGITLEDAEKLKVRFGSAIAQTEAPKTIRIRNAQPDGEPILVTTTFLSEIITSRLEEIMIPIFGELKKFEEQIGQVYITGGASRMANMLEYVRAHTSLPVEYGSHADWLDEQTDARFYGPEYSATVGAMLLGARFRREHPGQKLPPTKIPVGKHIFTRLTDLFTPPTE